MTLQLWSAKIVGGDAASAKLQVAREQGIPVVMVRRPDRPEGACVETVEGAVAWLDERMNGE